MPLGWRPGTQPLVDVDEDLIHERHRRNSDGVGTSFTHPLLGPIFMTSTGSFLALGLIAGVVTAFFPDSQDTIAD